MRSDHIAATAALGIPPRPATGDAIAVPRGAVKALVQRLWASHGDLDVAERKLRAEAVKADGDPRLVLLADILAECAKDPAIANGALRVPR
jgi:Flp pilus assembly protein TadD